MKREKGKGKGIGPRLCTAQIDRRGLAELSRVTDPQREHFRSLINRAEIHAFKIAEKSLTEEASLEIQATVVEHAYKCKLFKLADETPLTRRIYQRIRWPLE